MVQIKATGEFVFEGKKWTFATQKMAERLYFKAYHKWVNIFNEHIKEFNEEWENLHPEIDTMEDNSPEWFMYNKFIADKMEPYDNSINAKHLSKSFFEVRTDTKTATFTLRFKKYPTSYMTLEFKDFEY